MSRKAAAARAAFVPYPFAAIVGQDEAKSALLLAAINPRVGGVLLSGAKGVGKTSLVRAVADLLPARLSARCAYGCDPDGASLCDDCAAGRTAGAPRRVPGAVVELPASAQIDDVVGTLDLRAALERGAVTFRPGLLAAANRNLLYVDELNLLSDAIVDVLLDAAAQGIVRVKRGQQAVQYPARFVLVGTMNPEEGELRPQITDRIGLRVFTGGTGSAAERAEVYERNAAYARDPRAFAAAWAPKTRALRSRVARAVALLPAVRVEDAARDLAIASVVRLNIESHRTEFTALEAACALAALAGRVTATVDDVRAVFPLAARLRRSRLRVEARNEHLAEDTAIAQALEAPAEAAREAEPAPAQGGGLVVSPEFAERTALRARPQREREGVPVETRPLAGGRLDVPATVLSQAVAARSPLPAEPREAVEASPPPRLIVLVVDASQSTASSAAAIRAAANALLLPAYAERDRAALISCWGAAAETVVDEAAGRNVDLVAQRLDELDPNEARALTPLPDALDSARRMAERFRRQHGSAHVEIAVFSDGRANVPLGGESALRETLAAGGDARALAQAAADQCRVLAARLAGRAGATFVNVDPYEASPLMRELAGIAKGRYFPLNDIVARTA